MIKKKYMESIGSEVLFAKRRGTKHLRLTIKSDGIIRVSVPYGVPQIIAEKFIQSKKDWIVKHHSPKSLLHSGAHIGKSHELVFEQSQAKEITTRVTKNTIIVRMPSSKGIIDNDVQTKARQACERALKKQAENLLPQRVEYLSKKFAIDYRSASVKKLKSRWGSCDNHKNIILNIYLIQLEWELIDYVICHELAHTRHPHHQFSFWEEVESILPNYREKRKRLKTHPTDVIVTKF